MKSSCYRDRFTVLLKAGSNREGLSQLARQTAESFMDHYYQSGLYDAGCIDLMCEMATRFEDPEMNRAASSAFFSIIIEELCDDYEDFQFEAYARVMSQVISYCRNTPAGGRLDRYLGRFGLHSAEDLFVRASRIHTQTCRFSRPADSVRQIFLLSRITVGADVAIVSVILQRLSALFPQAQLILIGSPKLKEVFGANHHLEICPAIYRRGGGLVERIDTWCDAVDLVKEHTCGRPEDAVLIDPDSRMTQLGILPIVADQNYFYFNSHRHLGAAENACMAEQANGWVDHVFGSSGFCYPQVWVEPGFAATAQTLIRALRQNGTRQVTVVNFGVGGNPRKRIGIDFEKQMVGRLLAQPGSVVVLDKGFGADEQAASQDIIAEMKRLGYPARDDPFDRCKTEGFSGGLLALDCSIGQISALIAAADDFIGYDSACQHIAAASAVPTVTIFAGSNNPRFIRRWSACGNTACNVVHVDTLGHPESVNVDEIIERIMAERAPKARSGDNGIRIIDVRDSSASELKKERLTDLS